MTAPTTEPTPPGPDPGPYPAELERTWTPAGRPPVRIRALRHDDLEREARFIKGLSRETLYLRMQYYASQPTPRDLERLLDLDYLDRLAIAGLALQGRDECIVGVSRFARIAASQRAEFAIVVADDWQGCGLGTELMRSLIHAALARGYTCLEAQTLAENLHVSSWARRFGFSVRTEPGSGGLVKVTLELENLEPAE